MLLLVSVISGAGYGGVQAVNELILSAAQGASVKGCVVSLHDSPGAQWTQHWDESICAQGSRLKFTAGALSRRMYASDSLTLATHVALTPVGRCVKKLGGGKLATFLHGVEVWKHLPKREAWGLDGSDLLIANSHYTLKKFRAHNPSLEHLPGIVCYLPARSLKGGRMAVPPITTRREKLRVLIVGRLWGRGLLKGQRELILIWPQVLSRFPSVELWIVGEGEGRHELEKLTLTAGVAGAVRFTGSIPDAELDALYRESDLYAMPSRGEGFGLVFAEAMLNGLPCIASRFDAGSEVVTDGETGLLVDPENAAELTEAVCKLLGDVELRERMGLAGQRRAAELFSLDGFNRRMERILRCQEEHLAD